MNTYVLQTRWLGMDDWVNAVYVAPTEEEAKQQSLNAENQQKREAYNYSREYTDWLYPSEAEYADESGDYEGDWTSLEQIAENGEFHFVGWYVGEH